MSQAHDPEPAWPGPTCCCPGTPGQMGAVRLGHFPWEHLHICLLWLSPGPAAGPAAGATLTGPHSCGHTCAQPSAWDRRWGRRPAEGGQRLQLRTAGARPGVGSGGGHVPTSPSWPFLASAGAVQCWWGLSYWPPSTGWEIQTLMCFCVHTTVPGHWANGGHHSGRDSWQACRPQF